MSWCIVSIGAQQVLDAGDIIFTKADLRRERHVLAHPGQRLVLVDEWPGKNKKKAKKLPNVLHWGKVPQDKQGDFSLPWLPGVTVHALNGADLIKPRSDGADEALVATLEEIFQEALAPGQSDFDALQYVYRLRTELSNAIGGDCIDDPVLNAATERNLRAVLQVFGDRQRLSWAVKYMFEDAYLEGNELMLGDLHTKDLGFDLRMHVWHDWTSSRNISFYSMPHEHGQTMIASTQVVGYLEQHVYQSGGENLTSAGFEPILLRTDEGSSVNMKWVEFEGASMRVDAGSSYYLPVRWIHNVLMPSVDSISIEVRKALFGKNCEDNHPARIRVLDHWKKPKTFTDMLYFRWPEVRRKVAAYLAYELEELDEDGYKNGSHAFRDILDGPHMDLTKGEKKELEKTSRFYEGVMVKLTSSRKKMLKAFKSAPPRHKHDERMDPMLGHTFKVWKQLSDRMVSLIDPADELGIGPSLMEPFYFPPSILKVVSDDAHGNEL